MSVGNPHQAVLKKKNAGSGSQAEEWQHSNLRGRDKEGAVDITDMHLVILVVEGRVKR